MSGTTPEMAAIIFPVTDQLKEQYALWSASQKSNTTEKAAGNGYSPVFIPVYPAYPGSVPYPATMPVNTSGACTCGGKAATAPPFINPFILFLILILLILGTRREQILSALRKLILDTEPPQPPGLPIGRKRLMLK